MNPSSLTPEGLRNLLQLAGQRLGATPQQLEAILQTGDAAPLASKLPPEMVRKLNGWLGDRDQVQRLLDSPEVQSFLRSSENP